MYRYILRLANRKKYVLIIAISLIASICFVKAAKQSDLYIDSVSAQSHSSDKPEEKQEYLDIIHGNGNFDTVTLDILNNALSPIQDPWKQTQERRDLLYNLSEYIVEESNTFIVQFYVAEYLIMVIILFASHIIVLFMQLHDGKKDPYRWNGTDRFVFDFA